MRNFAVVANGILVMALGISLLVPFVSVDKTSAQVDTDVVLWGKSTAYSIDQTGAPPVEPYVAFPPLFAVAEVGEGRVAVGGTVATCRNDRWTPGEWDVFLDEVFQWMKPGATKLLWYEGHNVYNNTERCSDLVAALEGLGYTVRGDDRPISEIGLGGYDVLIIPQLQLGTPGSGGDPNLLPDDDVQAIVDFVNGGGGLLVMDGSDFLGYHFSKVQNKIIEALGLGVRFQDDQVSDDKNNAGPSYQPIVDVDTTTAIGGAYQGKTGSSEITLYSICSLRGTETKVVTYMVSLKISPAAGLGESGEDIVYNLTVINTGGMPDDYSLTVEDELGWAITVPKTEFSLGPDESENVQITVTVPDGLEKKILNRLIAKVTGASGVRENVEFRAINTIPRDAPPYPIVRPEKKYYWFSVNTVLVDPPAVPIMTAVETGYSVDLTPREPQPVLYDNKEFAPVGAIAFIGEGRVVALGGLPILRSAPSNQFGDPSLAAMELMPLVVKWLIDWGDPREYKYLFYYTEDAFHGPGNLELWLDTLRTEIGFEVVEQEGGELTLELLQGYDVLQLVHEVRISTASMQAVADWVRGGGALLLMEQADYGGYGDVPTSNEILEVLECPVRFNDDEVYDLVNWTKDGPWFPQVYIIDPREENPEFDIWFPPHAVTVSVYPKMISEFNKEVEYKLTLTNLGTQAGSYGIEVKSARGWDLRLEQTQVEIPPGESVDVTVTVSIPGPEDVTRDELSVAVTNIDQPWITASTKFNAVADPEMRVELPVGTILAVVVIIVLIVIAIVVYMMKKRG
jgi:hypothetical protein